MTRAQRILTALAAVLLVVVWYFLVWSPRVDELAAVETSIEDVHASQRLARERMGYLQSVRERAPELQAELTAARAIVPSDTSLPSALRQLQQAVDDSGATLVSMSPGRPINVEGADPELYSMVVSLEVRGSYFQVVDALRRLEDPTLSPRGFVWEGIDLALDDGSTLTVNVTGDMFAVLPAPPAPGAPDEGGDTTDDQSSADEQPTTNEQDGQDGVDAPPADAFAAGEALR